MGMQFQAFPRYLIWSLLGHGLVIVILTVSGATDIMSKMGRLNGTNEFVDWISVSSRTIAETPRRTSEKRRMDSNLARSKPAPVKQELRPTPHASEKTVSSGPAGMGERSSYLGGVLAAIERNKFYPREARRRRLTGEVTVAFTIQKDGTATDIRVDCECAHEILNQAAIEVVASIRKFDPIPSDLGTDKIDLKVPIEFELL